MFVKQQLVIFDKPIIQTYDIGAVDQMLCADQCFGTPCAQLVAALIDEQAMFGTDCQII